MSQVPAYIMLSRAPATPFSFCMGTRHRRICGRNGDIAGAGLVPTGPNLRGSPFVFNEFQLTAPGRPGLRAWLGAGRDARATVSAAYSALYGLSCDQWSCARPRFLLSIKEKTMPISAAYPFESHYADRDSCVDCSAVIAPRTWSILSAIAHVAL